MTSNTEKPGQLPQPQVGYGQPQQGYGQPQQGYGQPMQGYGQPIGYTSPDNVNVVVAQPNHVIVQNPGVQPPDYLILSIVSCFFCWPMAICALVFSNNSRNSSHEGNYSKALSDGRTARNIGIAAIVIGIILIITVIILNFLVFNAYRRTTCIGTRCYYG